MMWQNKNQDFKSGKKQSGKNHEKDRADERLWQRFSRWLTDVDNGKLRRGKVLIVGIMAALVLCCWGFPEFQATLANGDWNIFARPADATTADNAVVGNEQTGKVEIIETPGVDAVPPSEPQKAAGNSDYFVNYRMERDRIRAEQVELLQRVVDSAGGTTKGKAAAEKKIEQISGWLAQEVALEGTLQGKGVDEIVVFIESERVNVILAPIDTEKSKMTVEKVAQIASETTKRNLSNIFITVKNSN